MKNKVKNKIDDSKHSRKKNLLPALDKALNELDTNSNWVAKNPKEVQYSCCSTCIFGSKEFDTHKENLVAYNIQDLEEFRRVARENKQDFRWSDAYYEDYGEQSRTGEYIYLQHSGKSHKDYLKLIEVLNKHGIFVSWNWDSAYKIKVILNKYKEVLNG